MGRSERDARMPTFVLWIKAELEAVSSIALGEGGHGWCFDVKEPAGYEEKEGIWVSPDEEIELNGSRGKANYVMKWPDTKKEASMSIVKLKDLKCGPYTLER